MVDEAAKAAGYWLKAFHQTSADEFQVFDMRKTGTGAGGRNGVFARDAAYFTIDGENIRTLIKDLGLGMTYGTREIQVYLKPDALKDHIPAADLEKVKAGEDQSGMEIAITDANRIKSADPVTYDSDGNVIPLSQRHHSLSPPRRTLNT